MCQLPRPIGQALWIALMLGLATPGASQAQTVTVTPQVVSTGGGTAIKHGLDGMRGLSATVVLNAVTSLGPPITSTTAITYIDLPQILLTTPVVRISTGTSGEQSNGGVNWQGSHNSANSADGRVVAFLSDGRFQEFTGGTTGQRVVYRRSQYVSGAGFVDGLYMLDAPFTGTPERVDVNSAGESTTPGSPGSAAVSGNGRFVAFTTSANLDGASRRVRFHSMAHYEW